MAVSFPTLHPITLLSRSDTPTSSLYHSFFLVNLVEKTNVADGDFDKEVVTVWRVPDSAPLIDDIEAGVKFFVACIPITNSSDVFGSFVITTSNGSRFFAAWRGSNSQLFVSVSFFSTTFTTKTSLILTNKLNYRYLNSLCYLSPELYSHYLHWKALAKLI
jgi:hypothetical protein